MMLRRLCAVAVLLAFGVPALVGAQQGTIKGRGSAKVIFGTPKCGTPEGMKRGQPIPECAAPSPADIANAERRAGLNAIERFVSDQGVDRVKAFDRAKDTILEKLDDVVMSSTELSRNVDATARTLQLVVSVEINETRLKVILQGAQAATGVAGDVKRGGIGSFMIARTEGEIEGFLVETRRQSSDNTDVQRVATTDRSGRSQAASTSSDEQIAGRSAAEQRNSQVAGRDQVSQNIQVQGTSNSQASGTNNSRASATDNSTVQQSGSARVQTSERGDATFDQTKTKNVQRSEDLSDPSRSSSDTRKVQSTTASGTANYEGSANVSAEGRRSTTYDGTRSSASDATRSSSYDATRNSNSDVAVNSARASNTQLDSRDSSKRVVNRSAASEYSSSSTDMAGENVSRSASSQSGGSDIRRADQVQYTVFSSEDLDVVLGETLNQGGYSLAPAGDVGAEGEDPEIIDIMKDEYGAGNDLKATTIRRMTQAARKAGLSYLIIGRLDLTMPDVDNISGDKRVFAKVTAKVYDVTKPLAMSIVTVGPAQYQGLGPNDAVARTNALKNSAREVARTVLDGLNNR